MNVSKEVAEAIYTFFRGYYSELPTKADVAFVFGRNDKAMALSASALYMDGLVENILVTGGFGKDSGDLPVTEADFLASAMYMQGVPGKNIIVERTATNGAENSRLGMQKLRESGVSFRKVILVGHPISLVRFWAVHTKVTQGDDGVEYQLFAPHYNLQPEDYNTLFSEYLRLLEWPAKHWADQVTLPAVLTCEVQKIQQQ